MDPQFVQQQLQSHAQQMREMTQAAMAAAQQAAGAVQSMQQQQQVHQDQLQQQQQQMATQYQAQQEHLQQQQQHAQRVFDVTAEALQAMKKHTEGMSASPSASTTVTSRFSDASKVIRMPDPFGSAESDTDLSKWNEFNMSWLTSASCFNASSIPCAACRLL